MLIHDRMEEHKKERIRMRTQLRASESVTEGHPDSVCNKIAGAILDEAIRLCKPTGCDPKVAIEVSAKGTPNGGTLLLFGEVTLPTGIAIDYASVARRVLHDIGYTDKTLGFSEHLSELLVRISEQSSDIARGVNTKKTGAGDQGMMFGGAVTGEGPEYMPLPIMIAHALTLRYTELYKKKLLPMLRPDAKAQVVVEYCDTIPVRVRHITVAASHDPLVAIDEVRNAVYRDIIAPVLESFSFAVDRKREVVINGGGAWTVYGPLADAGTTNRKIIVDTYGGAFCHGGGGFNGKDWTKVDVTGAVGARYLAKRLVAEGLVDRVQVAVCYALGIPEALGVAIEDFNTSHVSDALLRSRADEIIDLSVDGILNTIAMKQPIYEKAASGGWFGRSIFPWEKIS